MRRALLVLLLVLGASGRAAAQSEAMTRAYALERGSNFAAAADAYAQILRENPDNLSALLGLERSLGPLRREAELALPAEALLAVNPSIVAAYSIAMRGWAAAGRPDSLASVARRWAVVEPGSDVPYREWGNTLLAQRDGSGARRAYLTGRERLGDPAALAGELALLAAAQNNWEEAAREWALAMDRYPGYRITARNALLRAPVAEQERILRQLAKGTPAARRLGAELAIQWGQPAAAYAQLMSSLPAGQPEAVDALRQFLDAARGVGGAEAAVVRGQALEQLADRTSGSGASRLRLEAARAYADGGDAASARRMLGTLASDGGTPPDMAATAAATLVTVLVREGQVAEAQRQLDLLRPNLGEDNIERLTLQVAEGWIAHGDLDRAEAVLASDSTVEAMAVTGRIRLYRGDLAGASAALRAAGPFVGTRDEATARTALLTLIQPIEADSLPALGAALYTLARHDSTAAVAALLQVADALPPAAGGAELRLLAGRIALGQGRTDEAERLLRSAAASKVPATAPAAELVLARLLLTAGRTGEAVALLEHLILTYPGSASVPQARRVLDAARGGIPET